MSAENITVRLQCDPNKDNTIEVEISQNATVSELEKKVKDTLVTLDDVPMGILKFNEQELNDKNKTLNELGIEDGSIIENENRVFLKTLNGKEIGITCDENTTVREFLKQLKSKNPRFSYIRLVFAGASLQKSTLDQKLLGCQMGTSSIKYGAILRLIIPIQLGIMYKSDTVFDLNNLE